MLFEAEEKLAAAKKSVRDLELENERLEQRARMADHDLAAAQQEAEMYAEQAALNGDALEAVTESARAHSYYFS